MPGGLTEPLGLLAFPAIKMAGYTAYSVYLNQVFKESPRNVFAVGASRMLIGIIIGTFLTLISFPFIISSFYGVFIYVAGLIPIRIFEWWVIIKLFYGGPDVGFSRMKIPIALGVVSSFSLDIPALIGVVYAASFWIC